MKRTALITGVTGFAGSRLARELIRRGYTVRGLVRSPVNLDLPKEVHVDLGDITRQADVDQAVRGADVVFHLAALYRSARHADDVYRRVNVNGTGHVLDAVRRHRVSLLVHCSTIGVHGDVGSVPADESSPLAPGDIYQQTKLEGEMLVQQAIRQGMRAVVVRPAGIYGPGDRRFLKLFRLIKSRRFRMIGTGKALFHPVHIDDLTEGLARCAERPAACGGTYILAGPRYVTLNELCGYVAQATFVRLRSARFPYRPVWAAAWACEAVCRGLSIEPPLHRRRVEFFVKNRAFCMDRARCDLNYEPRVELQDGLRQTSQWYLDNGWL